MSIFPKHIECYKSNLRQKCYELRSQGNDITKVVKYLNNRGLEIYQVYYKIRPEYSRVNLTN